MRRLFLAVVTVALALGLLGCSSAAPAPTAAPAKPAAQPAAPAAPAQQPAAATTDYPTRPITCIIPLEAGSGGDILTRPLLEKSAQKLGQPIVVVNKPGGSGSIGLTEVHNAKPDGYTLGMTSSFMATNKMQGIMPWNQHDYDWVGLFQTDPAIVVSTAKRPWKTIKEMADYAKAHPEEVSVATSAKGAIWWIASVALADSIGAKLNIIPQAGAGGLAVTQVAGGNTDLAVLGLAEAKSQIDAGNVRLLAVQGPDRIKGKYSDAPTMKEAGYTGSEVWTTRSVVAPKGLPKPVNDKLIKAFGEVATSEEYTKFLLDQNSIPLWLPGQEAVKNHDEQEKVFGPILEKAGLLKK